VGEVVAYCGADAAGDEGCGGKLVVVTGAHSKVRVDELTIALYCVSGQGLLAILSGGLCYYGAAQHLPLHRDPTLR